MYVDKDKDGKYSIMDISGIELSYLMSGAKYCEDAARRNYERNAHLPEASRVYRDLYRTYRKMRQQMAQVRYEPMTVENYKPENDTEL